MSIDRVGSAFSDHRRHRDVGSPEPVHDLGQRDRSEALDGPDPGQRFAVQLKVGGTTDSAAWMPIDEVPLSGPRAGIVDVAIRAWRDARQSR